MAHLRNLRKSVVIIPAPHAGEAVITLHPRGDISGADAVMVDDDTLKAVSVKNALSRGYIEEVSDEEMETIRLDAGERAEEEKTAAEEAISASIETRQDTSIMGLSCIGPGVRPTLPCENMVLRPSKEVRAGEVPPLCKAHASLAHEYTYTEGRETNPNTGESRSVSTWVRMAMGDPVKPVST